MDSKCDFECVHAFLIVTIESLLLICCTCPHMLSTVALIMCYKTLVVLSVATLLSHFHITVVYLFLST